jgi:hypothetical protein
MKRSLTNSLSWSFLVISAVALGVAACAPEDRNFGDPGGTSSSGAGGSGGAAACIVDMSEACYSGTPETLEVGVCKGGMHVCLASGIFSECGGEVTPTVENCLTPEDEACNGNVPAECPILGNGWLKTFGSLNFGQSVQDIAITSTGEIVVVGGFFDTIKFGPGPLETLGSTGSSDIFVAKFDQLGNVIWSRRFGDSSAQVAFAVAVDNMGAIYVGGSMAGKVDFDGTILTSNGADDGFLARFEPDGKLGWAQNWGDINSQYVRQIEVTKTNSIVVAGEFKGTIPFDASLNKITSAGNADIFVAKFDTSGFLSVARGFGGTLTETIRGLAVDGSDQIYLTGGFEGTADFGGTMLGSTGARDAYVTRLKPNLNTNIALGFGNPNGPNSFQEGYDVAINVNNEVFVVGGFAEGVDVAGKFLSNPDPLARSMYLAHFDGLLANVLDARQFGGMAGVVADARLAIDSTNKQLVIAGTFTGDMDFGNGMPLHCETAPDPFFAKLAFDGTFVAARSLPNDATPGDNANTITALALLPVGDLIIGGIQRTPIVYGPMIVGEADSKDGNAMLGRFLH